jgi:hypothetical protein
VEEDGLEEDSEELCEEGDREHGVAPGRVGDAGLFGWAVVVGLEWEWGKADADEEWVTPRADGMDGRARDGTTGGHHRPVEIEAGPTGR